MTALELARIQFGVTTLYHFIFVPVTIGMALFVAICQTAWYRTGNESWLRATRFWGKLMLISFALGVATGIVQEFQFGMNWSQYSRYVGDIFGAPLAMEGLAAFFVESTFLGLWLFGWGRLSARIHLAVIWLVAGSTMLSAYFILAANSWMQHPVGYTVNAVTKRAELDSIWAVLTNSTALMAFAHTILAALTTAGLLVIAVSAWHLLRRSEMDVFSRSMRIALPGVAVAVLLTMVVGHFQGNLLDDPAADEDGRGRRGVRHRDGRRAVALRHRRLQEQPGRPEPQHRDPAPAVDHRDEHLERRGQGHQPAQRRVPREVRPGRLRADRRRHLLDVAGDDRGRHADARPGADRACPRPPRESWRPRGGG